MQPIYCLTYNGQKNLIGNPHATSLGTNDSVPQTLLTNLNNYLHFLHLEVFYSNDLNMNYSRIIMHELTMAGEKNYKSN